MDNFLNKWTNGKLPLHDDQTINDLRKIAWASVSFWFSVFRVSMSPCLHVSTYPKFRKRKMELTEKRQLPFVLCQWKTETANFRLLLQTETENWVVSFGQQMINSNRRLLFQQTCPFIPICTTHKPDYIDKGQQDKSMQFSFYNVLLLTFLFTLDRLITQSQFQDRKGFQTRYWSYV